MAVRTNRGLPVAAGDRLPVNALHEFLSDRLMTLGAGFRHVELEDGRLAVTGLQNFVRTVTIGTDRSLLRTCRNGSSVNALLIRDDQLRTVTTGGHHKFLSVAGSAGCRDIHVVDARLGIAGRQQLVRAAVAIRAGRRLVVSSLDRFRVVTAVVSSLLVCVAGSTRDFCGRIFVG